MGSKPPEAGTVRPKRSPCPGIIGEGGIHSAGTDRSPLYEKTAELKPDRSEGLAAAPAAAGTVRAARLPGRPSAAPPVYRAGRSTCSSSFSGSYTYFWPAGSSGSWIWLASMIWAMNSSCDFGPLPLVALNSLIASGI